MPIRKLSVQLANQIAAGEVVERPASAVKELLENAVDAKATSITLEIRNAGKMLIKVSDNGVGIPKDELCLALAPHATSKISKLEDLDAIYTLGFRGEALASISSVSKLSLISNTHGQEHGYKVEVSGPEQNPEIVPAPHPIGTSVIVRELFFNVPARRRFLKSDKTEFNHIKELITKLALVNYHIEFKFIAEGKVIFHVPQGSKQNLKDRIEKLLGNDFKKDALLFDTQEESYLALVENFLELKTTESLNSSLVMQEQARAIYGVKQDNSSSGVLCINEQDIPDFVLPKIHEHVLTEFKQKFMENQQQFRQAMCLVKPHIVYMYGIILKPPALNQAVPDRLITFLNGRAICDKTVNHAIKEGYLSAIETNNSTVRPSLRAVIFMYCDPHVVDVNVHPRKDEVRFHDSNLIHDCIVRNICTIFQANNINMNNVHLGALDVPRVSSDTTILSRAILGTDTPSTSTQGSTRQEDSTPNITFTLNSFTSSSSSSGATVLEGLISNTNISCQSENKSNLSNVIDNSVPTFSYDRNYNVKDDTSDYSNEHSYSSNCNSYRHNSNNSSTHKAQQENSFAQAIENYFAHHKNLPYNNIKKDGYLCGCIVDSSAFKTALQEIACLGEAQKYVANIEGSHYMTTEAKGSLNMSFAQDDYNSNNMSNRQHNNANFNIEQRINNSCTKELAKLDYDLPYEPLALRVTKELSTKDNYNDASNLGEPTNTITSLVNSTQSREQHSYLKSIPSFDEYNEQVQTQAQTRSQTQARIQTQAQSLTQTQIKSQNLFLNSALPNKCNTEAEKSETHILQALNKQDNSKLTDSYMESLGNMHSSGEVFQEYKGGAGVVIGEGQWKSQLALEEQVKQAKMQEKALAEVAKMYLASPSEIAVVRHRYAEQLKNFQNLRLNAKNALLNETVDENSSGKFLSLVAPDIMLFTIESRYFMAKGSSLYYCFCANKFQQALQEKNVSFVELMMPFSIKASQDLCEALKQEPNIQAYQRCGFTLKVKQNKGLIDLIAIPELLKGSNVAELSLKTLQTICREAKSINEQGSCSVELAYTFAKAKEFQLNTVFEGQILASKFKSVEDLQKLENITDLRELDLFDMAMKILKFSPLD